jgi:hypothetical protein
VAGCRKIFHVFSISRLRDGLKARTAHAWGANTHSFEGCLGALADGRRTTARMAPGGVWAVPSAAA